MFLKHLDSGPPSEKRTFLRKEGNFCDNNQLGKSTKSFNLFENTVKRKKHCNTEIFEIDQVCKVSKMCLKRIFSIHFLDNRFSFFIKFSNGFV